MSALFSMRILDDISKSVKISQVKSFQNLSRTKTGGALICVVHDRYKVALAISLSFKASVLFPDRKFWLKNGPKSRFSGKSEKSANFAGSLFFYFQCLSNIKIHFESKFRQKI